MTDLLLMGHRGVLRGHQPTLILDSLADGGCRPLQLKGGNRPKSGARSGGIELKNWINLPVRG